MNTEPDQDNDGQSERRKSRRSSADRSARMEEEVIKIANDDKALAREILLLKKEIGRLHYKVKNYNSQNRVINFVIAAVIIALLVVIAYRLYDVEIPHVKVK
jgi:hypothetical protein